MAEIIETKIAQYQYNIHKITCDKCGKHIYDSEEYDDGYYDDPGEYEQAIYIEGKQYKETIKEGMSESNINRLRKRAIKQII